MRIAGASRGWLRREQDHGGIGRRPLSRLSSSFLLPGRPTPGLGRVRGAQEVDAFSVAFFSLPRGDGTGRPQSFGSGFSPAGSKARVGPDRGVSGHQASFRLAHSDEPCSSPRLDEVRDFDRRRAQHIVWRRSQLRKHLTE